MTTTTKPMDDRELLELAAKAAGMRLAGWEPCEGGYYIYSRKGSGDVETWLPLADDGDALRLAVKLGLLIDVRYKLPETQRYNGVTYWPNPMHGVRLDFGDRESDPCTATRRAIVRAAAEIARQEKDYDR